MPMSTEPFDLQPTLAGETITLRPLERDDFEALYAAASDPAIWAQHPDSKRHERSVFEDRFFAGAIDSGGAFALVENIDGKIVGSTRFYDWDEQAREVAIGYTFVVRRLWGSGVNEQMKALLLNHAFAHVRRVWFHVAKDNIRSRRAVEKLGCVVVREEPATAGSVNFVRLHYRLDALPEAPVDTAD